MQIKVMQKLISIRRWFDSVQLLKELSRINNFDPKELQTVIGWEQESGYFLDVCTSDKEVLSIQFKSSAAKKYWMYLNIGSVAITTLEEDLMSTEMLNFLVQSVQLVSNLAQHGSISLKTTHTGGIDILYTIPLPSWSLLSLNGFTRLIHNVINETQSTLKEVQARNLVSYQNRKLVDDEFTDFEEYEDDSEPHKP